MVTDSQEGFISLVTLFILVLLRASVEKYRPIKNHTKKKQNKD